jgi:Peptidase S46
MEGNAITKSLLADHFVRARRWLPKDDPFLKVVLGELEIPAAIARLGQSKLADDKFTKDLITSGADAVAKSDDPGVAAGAVLWPLMREAARQQKELDAREKVLGTRMGLALFAVYGTQVAPDATMTLRFSDGRVQGYPYNGTLAPWATSFYGLYARSTEFGNQKPWELAKVFFDAQDKVDMTAKVCFASTNDIIGGNSGSVVVDQALQVVGLIFDGNIESLSNNFWYLQDNSRAVSVHTDAIATALKVYGAGRVFEELSAGWKDAGK